MIIAGLTSKSLEDNVFIEEIVKAVASILNLVIAPPTVNDEVEAVNLMREYSLDYDDAFSCSIKK